MDFLYQFNLGLIATLFTGSFHEMFEKNLAGLWSVGEVDNHAIYGSKVVEGFRRSNVGLVMIYCTKRKSGAASYKNMGYMGNTSSTATQT